MENESPRIIRKAAKYIYHCDLAEKEGRTAPGVHGQDFTPYFQALKDIGYQGKIAIECRWEDMAEQLPSAVAVLGNKFLVSSFIAVAPATSNQKLRSEEHTSELQSLMRISYAVFCLKKKKT